jgi:hypothetical protein
MRNENTTNFTNIPIYKTDGGYLNGLRKKHEVAHRHLIASILHVFKGLPAEMQEIAFAHALALKEPRMRKATLTDAQFMMYKEIVQPEYERAVKANQAEVLSILNVYDVATPKDIPVLDWGSFVRTLKAIK